MSDLPENFSDDTNGEQNEPRNLQEVENCEVESNKSSEGKQIIEEINSYADNGYLKTSEDSMSLTTYRIQEEEFQGRVRKFIDNIDARVASNQLVLAQETQSQILANIQYLRYLQFGFCYLEARYFKEMYALECKYERLLEPLSTLRKKIVEGSFDPEDVDGEDEQVDESSAIVGIPLFWLSVFKNSPILSSVIAERDEAVLSHLVDVRITMHEMEPAGFTLEFEFSPNEFFSNLVLVKSYYLNCMPDASNPLSFNGPEAYRSTGCAICWNEGMDVTTRLMKKVVRRPNGRVGTITQIVRCSSFFNLFSSNANDSLHYDEVTIGNHIRAVVPRAFLFFVGDVWQTDDTNPEPELVPEIEECAISLNNLSL